MVRTFVAIDVNPEPGMVDLWLKLKLALKNDGVKWVGSDIVHLTILFLGETPENSIKSIANALKAKLETQTTFQISAKGLGTFGKPIPKVIWVGIEPNRSLERLKQAVDEAMLPFGYKDKSPFFAPHLTLGRVKFINGNTQLHAIMDECRQKIIQNIIVDRVVFYQSTLTPSGSAYKPIEIVELKRS